LHCVCLAATNGALVRRRGIEPEINAIATLMRLFSVVIASVGLYLRARRK